jgi:hypothetical protein
MPTMTELSGKVGFASPASERKFSRRRGAVVELMATLALAVSFVIAATAVSIGVARAQVLGAAGGDAGAPLAIAIFLGLFMAAMGGLTALAARDRPMSRD